MLSLPFTRPVDDMFLSSEDYRAIGSGQIEVSTGAASSADLGNGSPSAGMGSATEVSGFVDPVEHYLRKANEKSGAKGCNRGLSLQFAFLVLFSIF